MFEILKSLDKDNYLLQEVDNFIENQPIEAIKCIKEEFQNLYNNYTSEDIDAIFEICNSLTKSQQNFQSILLSESYTFFTNKISELYEKRMDFEIYILLDLFYHHSSVVFNDSIEINKLFLHNTFPILKTDFENDYTSFIFNACRFYFNLIQNMNKFNGDNLILVENFKK